MVCDRCKKVVKDELEKLGEEIVDIELGRIVLRDQTSNQETLRKTLEDQGFELISDPGLVMVEHIRLLLIEQVSELPLRLEDNLSVLISRELGRDYSSLSRLFSRHEHITIERFFVKLKLEKVKELIQESTHSFSEIAYLLGYSSVNHLASQFRSNTGMSMSEYKQTMGADRKSLDKIV